MKITNFQIKLAWGVGLGAIVSLWIAFPLIFKLLIGAYDLPKDFNEFGAFGDIYGSLNTLISSIALCAVAFSTWLQVTSLKETRQANERQLMLAQELHEVQIKESRYAVFINMFNSLMVLKQTKLESLKIKNSEQEFKGFEIFNFLADSFSNSFDNEFKDISTVSENDVKNQFFRVLKKLNGNEKFYDLGSFFLNYENLLNLINESNLDSHEKEYFKTTVRNSMSGAEQLTLFWMGAYSAKFKSFLNNSQLFSQFYSDKMMPFAIKFHDRSSFSHPTILKNWDKF